ncbi:MAG: type I-C CRISPR-associated protein Cas8c/Csd1, partial [Fimbriimonadales bacterium]
MILKRIMEFAERQNPPPLGYQKRFITKIIQLDANGKCRGVLAEGPDQRGKQSGWWMWVPQESPARTSKAEARLIADNGEYVLGLAKEPKQDTPAARAKAQKNARHRHELWVKRVRECSGAVPIKEVQAVCKWVDAGGPADLVAKGKVEADDELLFEIDGKIVTDLPDVRSYWSSSQSPSGERRLCLVTGQQAPVQERMPAPIKGVPGGQPSGTFLITVNFPSGESYGLKASFNSPISEDAALKICNGLNELLNAEFDDPQRQRKRRKHALRVGPSVFLAWTAKETGFDFFNFLEQPSEEEVRQFLSQPLSGSEVAEPSENDFYVLCLSANAARIVVRDYQELTLARAKHNLAEWFRGLSLVSPDGSETRAAGVFHLAASLYREAGDMPAHVPTWLIRTALFGEPLPKSLLALAVKRNLAMQGPFAEANGRRFLSWERVALIKFTLQQLEERSLKSLDPNHPEPAYHCGRLLAVLEQIQRAALGDINATVVDRYYGAACTSPGTILGNLVNDAQAHLSKLRKDKGDYWAQTKLAEILSAIGPAFPSTL